MKAKDIIIFLSIFLFFFAALNIDFFVRQQQFKLCHPRDVTGIEIKTPDHNVTASFSSEIENWQITSKQLRGTGSDDALQKLALMACRLPYVEKLETKEKKTDSDLKSYGLDGRRQLIAKTNAESYVLTVGNETPSGTEFYLMNSEEQGVVYTIPNIYRKALLPQFMDLNLRSPFAGLDQGSVLEISFGDTRLSLKKDKKEWIEENGRISPLQTKTLIQSVESFNYKNYKGPLTPDEKNFYGIDFPDVTFEWHPPNAKPVVKLQFLVFNQRFYLISKQGSDIFLLVLSGNGPDKFMKDLETI